MEIEINSYEEWLSLSSEEKSVVSEKWSVYKERDGFGYALCASGRLIIESPIKIWNANPGIYHGGEWVIHAEVDKTDLPNLPKSLEQSFEGFRIIWMEVI